MKKNFSFIQKALEKRCATGQCRYLQDVVPLSGTLVKVAGQSLINFSSNDYLGLANCQALQERSIEYIHKYGNGSTASRLVCGNYAFLAPVEEKLAGLKGQESALLFNSGFQANVSVIPALANRNSLILADRLCHNSIVQGAILSRAKFVRFNHNDPDHLKKILAELTPHWDRIIIITESVFSMDGDLGRLADLSAIAQQYNAIFYVDEAHATGVFGENGMGLALGVGADVVMGTFGKGCGSFGAYIACPAEIKQYLINYCSGFIYSTALPPAVIGAVDAALDLVPAMNKARKYLAELANYLRLGIQKNGGYTGQSTSQIVPIYIGNEDETTALAHWLQEKGVFAIAIRPPTVESGKSRIRIALSALHTYEQIDQLINAFATRPQ